MLSMYVSLRAQEQPPLSDMLWGWSGVRIVLRQGEGGRAEKHRTLIMQPGQGGIVEVDSPAEEDGEE